MDDIVKYFPMPEFRPKQREILVKCHELFQSGYRLILLDAPVGFGKSAVNTALCRYYAPSIYTTPQLSLIDQIMSDKHLSPYFTEIKGRENYMCAKDMFMTSVKYGLCRRTKDHGCDRFKECPYYSQKLRAIQSNIALMSTAYYLVDAYLEPPNFSDRNLVVIDEGHMLAEHVANQVSLVISPHSLPKNVWNKCRGLLSSEPSIQVLERIAENVSDFLNSIQETLDMGATITDEEAIERIKAEEWLEKFNRYVVTAEAASWVWARRRDGGWTAMPVYARYMMPEMVWSRGYRFLISSATILDPDFWAEENGATMYFRPDEIAYVRTGMTFPKENRPVIDMSIGSMSYNDQQENLDRAIDMIKYIVSRHAGENIAIHVPSYELAEKIYEGLKGLDCTAVRCTGPEDRDAILAEWKKNGGVLVAVAYWEGQDWKYDICSVQILAKTLYPDVSDKRVAKRLEAKDYKWLMWTALVRCLQAYGRAIRAPDDRMTFYVLDDKFWELVRRMWKYVPEWFKEVVPRNRMPKYAQKMLKSSGEAKA